MRTSLWAAAESSAFDLSRDAPELIKLAGRQPNNGDSVIAYGMLVADLTHPDFFRQWNKLIATLIARSLAKRFSTLASPSFVPEDTTQLQKLSADILDCSCQEVFRHSTLFDLSEEQKCHFPVAAAFLENLKRMLENVPDIYERPAAEDVLPKKLKAAAELPKTGAAGVMQRFSKLLKGAIGMA